jgi:hypothetical protein
MTAPAGAGLRVTPANPNRTLAVIPATVTDLIERHFIQCMALLLIAAAKLKGD